jgi:hypothetical protein
MCQITVEWLFDRVWPKHVRKVASLFAQALKHFLPPGERRRSIRFSLIGDLRTPFCGLAFLRRRLQRAHPLGEGSVRPECVFGKGEGSV